MSDKEALERLKAFLSTVKDYAVLTASEIAVLGAEREELEREVERLTGDRTTLKRCYNDEIWAHCEQRRRAEAAEAKAEGLEREVAKPLKMLLFCPKCGIQHVDAPDERTPDWTNPPHRSHLCHACGCIWRPADVPTEGVAAIETKGSADTWSALSVAPPSQGMETPADEIARLQSEIGQRQSRLQYLVLGDPTQSVGGQALSQFASFQSHRGDS